MTENSTHSLKMFRRASLLLVAFFALTLSAAAQSKSVTGVVKDTKGTPIIGATVVVPGTSNGTTTDINGKYSLTIPTSTKVLLFSYIGMENKNLTVVGTTLDATLADAATQLDEVVVVGYGTQRKSDLTGSISSVSSRVIESQPVASTAQALTGRMAGVQVTTTEGGPDAEIKIRVRGGGSITQDNSPLYIVDGFPVTSISDVAPSDIASIDVLKDASATAIYGARGANGVVIVSTKSGKEGKPVVNFNAFWGAREITKKLDVLSPYEYAQWQWELATIGNAQNVTDYIKYYGAFEDIELYKYTKGNDWQEQLFGRTAKQSQYNLSVTGGNKDLKYNIGLTRNEDEGIMVGSDYVRNNIIAKLNGNISPKFSFDFNSRFSHTVINGAGTESSGNASSSRLKNAIKYTPMDALSQITGDDDDESLLSGTFLNPLKLANDDYRQTTRMMQTYNAAVNYKIIKNLTFRTEVGMELGTETTDRYYGPNTSQARNNRGLPMASIYKSNTQSLRNANTLTYELRDMWSKNHNLSVLLGQEASSYSTRYNKMESRYFSVQTSAQEALAMMRLGTEQPNESVINPDNNLMSFFGRLNYNGMNRYLFTFTMRADGSSKFKKGSQWGYFPSAAFAWRLSEEKFMDSSREWLDNLKLRLSVGMAGNNRIADDLWRTLYQSTLPNIDGLQSRDYYIGGIATGFLIPGSDLANPSLKWETTLTRDIGLDVSVFGSRLNLTADVYYNTTKDLLIRAKIPASTSFQYQMQNVGQTSNKGVELSIDGTIIDKKNFTLQGSFNIAMNRNKIDKLNVEQGKYSSYWYQQGSQPDADYWVAEGGQIGLIYGYKTDGMYSFDDFTSSGTTGWNLNAGVPNNQSIVNPRIFGPGALKFQKTNYTGTPETNPDYYKVTEQDRTIIGNTNPKHTGGFSLTANFYGFDASVFLNWSYGNDVYNANKLEFTSYPGTRLYGNILNIMNSDSRFSYVDKTTGAKIPNDQLAEYNKNAKMWSPALTSTPVHSWAIEDGSFLRLNNLTIGYTLPTKLTKKFFVSKMRVYVTGNNLAIWTKYSGYDPEVDSRRSTPLTPGVDYSAYPKTRLFVGGVNITF